MDRANRRSKITLMEALLCITALLAVVVVAYAIGRVSGADVERHQAASREYQGTLKKSAYRSCVNGPSTFVIACVARAVELSQSKSETRQGLYAQQAAAEWAYLAMLASWASTISALVGIYFVGKTLNATLKSVQTDTVPFLRVTPVDGRSLRWKEGNFNRERILITIDNAGRAPAFVTAIHRQWESTKKNVYPNEVQVINSSFRTDNLWIPIGPGSSSHDIDSLSSNFRELPVGDEWISFIGYVEFQDTQKRRYRSGFLHILRNDYSDRGLHFAVPNEYANKYNYHDDI